MMVNRNIFFNYKNNILFISLFYWKKTHCVERIYAVVFIKSTRFD